MRAIKTLYDFKHEEERREWMKHIIGYVDNDCFQPVYNSEFSMEAMDHIGRNIGFMHFGRNCLQLTGAVWHRHDDEPFKRRADMPAFLSRQ